jgi:hypothetical protein
MPLWVALQRNWKMDGGGNMGVRLATAVLAGGSLFLPSFCGAALDSLDDEDLAGISGDGLAFGFDNVRISMRNTAYIEQTGVAPDGSEIFQRGDLRWFGLTLSGGVATDGLGWTGSGESCGHLLCPIAMTGATIAAYDNPYVLRAFSYTGYDFQNASVSRTVLELVGPTSSDNYRWAFWGEAEVGKSGSANNGLLQSQTMIVGKPTNASGTAGSVLRILQHQNSSDPTFAMTYDSRISGSFRFSLAKSSASSDSKGSVPQFDNGTSEANAPGLIFRNVDAFIPFGQLYYQSLILDDQSPGGGGSVSDGNFVIELTQLPNQTNAWSDFYSTPGSSCTDARYTGVNCGYQRTSRPARYAQTHGLVTWGNWWPGASGGTVNAYNATDDGIIFAKATTAATFTAVARRADPTASQNNDPPVITYTRSGLSQVNLGDARITGLLINHMKITTRGAGS